MSETIDKLGELLTEKRLTLLIEPGYGDEPMLLVCEGLNDRMPFMRVHEGGNDLYTGLKELTKRLSS